MAKAERPLSPHLQIYGWYLTMALSIGHRASGVALTLGLPLLFWWLAALAGGPESFATVEWLKDSLLGVLVLFGYTAVLYYHLANGIRHLVWDAGYGFEPAVAKASGQAVLVAAGVLTVLTWIIIAVAG
jgi:succinate dehydrogenase / fumarate reductase cytochrome b subunit